MEHGMKCECVHCVRARALLNEQDVCYPEHGGRVRRLSEALRKHGLGAAVKIERLSDCCSRSYKTGHHYKLGHTTYQYQLWAHFGRYGRHGKFGIAQRPTGAGDGTMQIIEHDDGNRYEVYSDSGNTYSVTFTGRGDCGEVLWKCDCPAGAHGRECKHLRAVISFANERANELGR